MLKLSLILSLVFAFSFITPAFAQGFDRRKDVEMQLQDPKNIIPGTAVLLVYSDGGWSGSVLDTSYSSSTKDGYGNKRLEFECSSGGIYSMSFQKDDASGYLLLAVMQNGKLLHVKSTTAEYGVVSISGNCD